MNIRIALLLSSKFAFFDDKEYNLTIYDRVRKMMDFKNSPNGQVIQTQKGYSASQRGIAKLQTLGMIDPITLRKRDKIYCATKIFKILEEPTTIDEKDY